MSAHQAGAGSPVEAARSARESHPAVWVAVAVAVLLLPVHGWFYSIVILVLVGLRRWDRRWTLAQDTEATGPRPGRCVTHAGVRLPLSLPVAEGIARLALTRAEPTWRPVPAGPSGSVGGRARARVRRRAGRWQLVSIWATPADDGTTMLIIEVRSRVASRLYDGGATARTAAGLLAAIVEVTAESGREVQALPPAPVEVPTRVGWRWWHVAVAVAMFRLAGYPFRWADLALGTPLRGGGYLVVGQLFVASLVLAWLRWVSRTEGSGSWATDYGLQLRWPEDVFTGIPLGFALLVLESVVIAVLTHGTGSESATTSQVFVTARQSHWLAFWPLAAYAVVGAPFVEELTFRGLTLRGMERKVSVAWAIVWSGVLFGAGHWIVGEPFVADLILIVALGWSAWGSGSSRWPPAAWARRWWRMAR